MSEKNNFGLVLKESAGLPMVRIDRDGFLRTALSPHFDEDTVNKAIAFNPAYAGITTDEIKKIANSCINYETTKVTAISAAAGIPGGLAMIGTVPADLVQYFGHVLRIAQKLIYLYGWSELFDESGQMDDGTANLLTLFVGVMFGVNGAASAIVKISEAAAQKAAKSLAQKALTKGMIYPIVKKVATALGVKMTKDVFAKGVAKFIPIIGGVASGTVTYVTYKPMAKKLRNHLAELRLADAEFYMKMLLAEIKKDFKQQNKYPFRLDEMEEPTIPATLNERDSHVDEKLPEVILWALPQDRIANSRIQANFNVANGRANKLLSKMEEWKLIRRLHGNLGWELIPNCYGDLSAEVIHCLTGYGKSEDEIREILSGKESSSSNAKATSTPASSIVDTSAGEGKERSSTNTKVSPQQTSAESMQPVESRLKDGYIKVIRRSD